MCFKYLSYFRIFKKNQDMGGLPPKPPIGGRVASPKPPAKCLSINPLGSGKTHFVRVLVVIIKLNSIRKDKIWGVWGQILYKRSLSVSGLDFGKRSSTACDRKSLYKSYNAKLNECTGKHHGRLARNYWGRNCS